MLFPKAICCCCCIYSFRARTFFCIQPQIITGNNFNWICEHCFFSSSEAKYPQNPQVFPPRPHPDFVISAVHVSEFSLFVILNEARYCDLGGLTHFPALEVLESLLASLK